MCAIYGANAYQHIIHVVLFVIPNKRRGCTYYIEKDLEVYGVTGVYLHFGIMF